MGNFLTEEWGSKLVDGWADWIDNAQTAGDLLGRAILGVGPGQTLVCDTTSVNFYQLCLAAIKNQPGRKTVIVDSANFPTDRYIIQGIAEQFGLKLITLDTDKSGGPGAVDVESEHELIQPEQLERHLSEDVALLTLQALNYRSGARQPILEINKLAQKYGVLVVWDCSHAGGSVQLNFDENQIDLAVGCTYKYGNSGPGSPAWLFVRHNLQKQLNVPIQGWFAQADQFAMGPEFEPADSIRKFQIASPPIAGIRAVEVSYRMIEQAGIENIEKKAATGTQIMIELFDAWLSPLGFELGTPRDWQKRGGHVILTHPEAKQIANALRVIAKVIPDYREPNAIRLSISPLTNTYSDVFEGFQRLRDLVVSGDYKTAKQSESRVT
jgi:kynureninase